MFPPYGIESTMSIIADLIKSRISANNYDTERKLSDQAITDLIDLATHAPSAFNLQNWRFVAIRSEEAKARLLPLAYGQKKVVDSAVTFIVCGTLNPHQTIAASLKPSMDAGVIDKAIYDMWVGAVQGMYAENPQLQRDEAIRSGSLAAMTLMLAAKGQGLDSTPMIGFDPAAVAEAFNLSATEIPVMLVTVGYPGESNWPQKPRKAVREVLEFI
ncbi:nitroreductase family protein [Pseudomonas sp. SZ57]|nr:nitroreductase family protein [Pseudomonas sp. SZ57]